MRYIVCQFLTEIIFTIINICSNQYQYLYLIVSIFNIAQYGLIVRTIQNTLHTIQHIIESWILVLIACFQTIPVVWSNKLPRLFSQKTCPDSNSTKFE